MKVYKQGEGNKYERHSLIIKTIRKGLSKYEKKSLITKKNIVKGERTKVERGERGKWKRKKSKWIGDCK